MKYCSWDHEAGFVSGPPPASGAAGGPVLLLLSLGDLWRWLMSLWRAQAGIPG